MALNLLQKSDICAKLDKGISGNQLSKEYNVAKSTISYIKKHKNDIRRAISTPYYHQKNIRLTKSNRSMLEQALYEWILKQQEDNIFLSNKILKDKAMQIYYDIHASDEFRPGNKWLRNFKKRYNVMLEPEFCQKHYNDHTTNQSTYENDDETSSMQSKLSQNFALDTSENESYSMSESSESESNGEMNTSGDDSNESMSVEEDSEESEQDEDIEMSEKDSHAALDSAESDDFSEMDTHTTDTYSRFQDDDSENDPNVLCDQIRTLIHTNPEIKKVVSKLHDLDYIR